MRGVVVVVVGLAGCGIDARNLPEMTFGVDAKDAWADGSKQPVPAIAGEVRVLITNNLDDTVSVISLDQLLAGGDGAELSRFVVGGVPLEREGPHHCAVSPDGKFGYVGISNFVPGAGSGPHGVHGAGTAQGRALVVDLDTERTVIDERVDRNPGDVRLTPDGRRLLLTHFDLLKIGEAATNDVFTGPTLDARLAVLDAATLEREAMIDLCPAPHGVAITNDSKTAISSCQSDEAAVVDLDAGSVARVVLLAAAGTAASPVCGPYAVTLTGDQSVALISCFNTGELIGVDVAGKILSGDVVVLPGHALFGSTAADGTIAVAVQDSDGVAFVDELFVLTRFVSLTPDVCTLPHATRFIDDDTHLLVVCEGNKRDPGSLVVLDTASGAVLGQVPVGRFPDDLALQVKP
ncbi:MAG: hypothetical protein Q8O67_33485 [Deltaproteobacteria bacterium]|nr:hypothetical protein [Deltaproteobacteria bacterium]